MKSVVALLLLVSVHLSAAASVPQLDKPYRNLVHPIRDFETYSDTQERLPARSDIAQAMRVQTSVKDQGNRGTCSIFSATALVESMMIVEGRADTTIDLSEEWLQYLTTLKESEEGSDSPANFNLLHQYGIPAEQHMPYVSTNWRNKRSGLALKRCGHLARGKTLRACLISHRDPNLIFMTNADLLNPISHFYDPEFVVARADAFFNRDLLFPVESSRSGIVTSVTEIRRRLAQGIPMTMEFDFYYGSWNHHEATKLGINRSPKLWRQGAVTYPEKGSTDRLFSKKSPSGHSVLVVGYDDNREITYWVRKKNGRRYQVTRKGVYYFKNSWGVSLEKKGWGSEFEIDGIHYPGYGMILQDHAHDFGQFFQMTLK